MRYVLTLMAGIGLGAASWGIGSVLSGTFEPFDSFVGFLTTQVVLACASFIAGWLSGGRRLAVLLFGGYLGLNLYPYAFGGSESRAWAILGAVTTLSLIVFPILAGIIGLLIRRSRPILKGKGAQ